MVYYQSPEERMIKNEQPSSQSEAKTQGETINQGQSQGGHETDEEIEAAFQEAQILLQNAVSMK